MVNFGEFLKNLKLAVKQCYQNEVTKMVEKAKIDKCDIFDDFQTLWQSRKNEIGQNHPKMSDLNFGAKNG